VDRGREVHAGIPTPYLLAAQERLIGEYLLVADELGVVP
jgi:hypothetical protein